MNHTDIYGVKVLIKRIVIDQETEQKIFEKHSVLPKEIKKVLTEGKSSFKRVGGNQYLAIGLAERYLTIFFQYDSIEKEARITTAYPSSKIQIKSYRRKITK